MTRKQIDNLSLTERMQAPTPKLFRILKKVGIVLAAASAAVLAAPITLPAIVTTIAGYAATAGVVATAVSQAAVEGE